MESQDVVSASRAYLQILYKCRRRASDAGKHMDVHT